MVIKDTASKNAKLSQSNPWNATTPHTVGLTVCVSYSFQQPQSTASQRDWRCAGSWLFNLDAGYLTGMFNLWKSPHMSNSSVGTWCSLTHASLRVLLPTTSSVSPQAIPCSHQDYFLLLDHTKPFPTSTFMLTEFLPSPPWQDALFSSLRGSPQMILPQRSLFCPALLVFTTPPDHFPLPFTTSWNSLLYL